jgi:hypothetical protein
VRVSEISLPFFWLFWFLHGSCMVPAGFLYGSGSIGSRSPVPVPLVPVPAVLETFAV